MSNTLKRPLVRVLLVIVGLFLAIQLVPYGRKHTNPPVVSEPAWDSPTTRDTFFRTCGDCHSNETRWPWYSHIAPASWLVVYDVDEGRREFNVSEWGRPRNEGEEAAETLREGEMPQWYYTLMHPEARLAPEEEVAFIQGLVNTFGDEAHGEQGHDADEDDDGS